MKKVGCKERNVKRYKHYAQHRDAKGYTDYYISKAGRIPKSTFSAWKRGDTCPTVDTLMSICHLLGVSLCELLGDE